MKRRPYSIAPDIMVLLLSPTTDFEERKAAMLRLSMESWTRGWEDCDETYKEALALAGLALDTPVARA